ncbi:MAG TPA: hypothetical protein PK760_09165 [Flavobacteriales bacterium]|nr:hypothetical protein [Flavobacteriales bacterium]
MGRPQREIFGPASNYFSPTGASSSDPSSDGIPLIERERIRVAKCDEGMNPCSHHLHAMKFAMRANALLAGYVARERWMYMMCYDDDDMHRYDR